VIYLTVIAGLELLVIVLLVVAFLLERKGLAELLAHFEVLHQGERARIMSAPPRMVQPPAQPRQRSPEDIKRDQERAQRYAQVGTVQHVKEPT
jgi:hypothetical protein